MTRSPMDEMDREIRVPTESVGGDRQRLPVPAVTVQEQESVEPVGRHRLADLPDDVDVRLRRERHRSREPHVMFRLPVRQRRKPEEVEIELGGGRHQFGGEVVRPQRVGRDREVGRVLLDASGREHAEVGVVNGVARVFVGQSEQVGVSWPLSTK